jgi:uncharacterized protein (TIGR02594 family)
MKHRTKWTAVFISSVALAALCGPVVAKPLHHRHRPAVAAQASDVDTIDQRYPFLGVVAQASPGVPERQLKARRHATRRYAAAAEAETVGGYGSVDLVAEARKYIGTNPTGRGRLWCGAFMDLVLKHTGHKGGGNLALGYEHYGTRVSGPQVGAIAVMGRHGGGHVGVVTGIDGNGNPIIVSGNHNHTVAESTYPRGRIVAYVVPGG